MKIASILESDEYNKSHITLMCEYCYDSFTAVCDIGSIKSNFDSDTRYIRCLNCKKRSLDDLE